MLREKSFSASPFVNISIGVDADVGVAIDETSLRYMYI